MHQDIPGTNRFGQILKDLPYLADDRIRYHGDVVALVVAESRAQALAAVPLVRVDAEALPAVLDPEAALEPGAPLVHEAHGSNVINTHVVRRGDVAQGFAESYRVLERDFTTQTIEHAYLEPESALCWVRDDGVVEVHGSMQHPFSTRRFVANLLGRPLAEVEVVGTPTGGGFGGKDDTAALVCARAALAAQLTGRPVKLTYTREWSVRESYKRHPYRVRFKLGVGEDGRMLAAQVRIVADGGAYCSVTPWVTWRSTVQCCGPYEVPHVHCDTYGVYTNNVFTGAMRGFGSPQMNFVVEQMVDLAAQELGMDSLVFRRLNMVKQGSTTITGQVLDTHVVSLGEVMDKVLEASDFEAKRTRNGDVMGEERYGIGLAISYRGMSLGAEGVDFCTAALDVLPDGTVMVETGISENGQGAESAMVLLAAEALGVRRERVRHRRPSTSSIPDSGTTVASRGTLMGGGAVVEAARALKSLMADGLAPSLGCQPGEVRFHGDAVHGGQAMLPFEEAVRILHRNQIHPSVQGTYRAPRVDWDEHTGQGNAYFTWVYGCQCAEVAVHTRTGKVRLLNLVAAHEVGRVINREMVLGQCYGGMAMGAGYGLLEAVKDQGGRITTTNFNTYRIPRATDLPEMTAILVEHPDPLSPSGAKGVGEPTNELAAPAIANAVAAATGRRWYSLPLKVEA